jgi:dihydrodipicolinate synthase/N-acetylneuraminate lyase
LQKEAGADAVMVTPPAIPGYTNEIDLHILHYKAIEEVGLPQTIIVSPISWFGAQFFINTNNLRKLIEQVPSIVAAKITSEWYIGGFIKFRKAIKSVRDNVGCLEAGGQAHFAHYAYGAEGCLSGTTNFALEDDVQVYKLAKADKLKESKELSDSWMDVMDVAYGIEAGLELVHFHYRYKIVTWLLGIIDNPHMRLPQLPPPVEQIHMMRDALLRAGKTVVRNRIEPLAVASV